MGEYRSAREMREEAQTTVSLIELLRVFSEYAAATVGPYKYSGPSGLSVHAAIAKISAGSLRTSRYVDSASIDKSISAPRLILSSRVPRYDSKSGSSRFSDAYHPQGRFVHKGLKASRIKKRRRKREYGF